MRVRPLTIFLSLGWLILVLLVYYWIHKPITPAVVRSLGGAILDLLSAVLLIVIGGGIGRRILSLLFPQWAHTLSIAERVAGEALLGLGILSVLMFGIGLFVLTKLSISLLIITLAIPTAPALAGWLRDTLQIRRGKLATTWERGLALFIGVNLLMALLMTLTPPTKFDVLTYQLVGAKLWGIEGQFISLPGSHFFAFPQMMNTLYAGQMVLIDGRYTGAAPLHFMTGLLLLLAVGGYAARVLKPRLALVPPAILLTATTIWLQLTSAYVDVATAAYGIMLFIALDTWRRNRSTGWLILAAIFAGQLMSIKYTTVGWAGAGALYVLIYSLRERVILRPLIYVGIAALILSPWLLRNWAFYENPVYPFGSPTGEWDELSNEWYNNPADSMLQKQGWQLLSLPLSSTFIGIDGAGGYSSTIGPLFLLLIPFLLVTWRSLAADWQHMIYGALILIAAQTAFWVLSASLSGYGAQTRLVLTMFPVLALLAAIALDSLPRQPLDLAWMVRSIVILVFSLTLLNHVIGQRPQDGEPFQGTTAESHFLESRPLEYLTAILDRDAYLDDRMGVSSVAIREVNRLPDDAKVLFLWETRSLYCDEPRITCDEDSILMRWWHARRTIGDGSAQAIVQQWRDQGYTHVFIWETGRNFEFDRNAKFTDADEAEWAIVPTLLDEIWRYEDVYTLYSFR